MGIAIVTGSGGLVGSEAVRYFTDIGLHVIGIENNMRSYFFREEASTDFMSNNLTRKIDSFQWEKTDIRDNESIESLYSKYGGSIELTVHCAAQPSHDWAAREPRTDFTINALGTLNLLEAVRKNCPDTPFIFCSTNKVYGDTPNRLPIIENEKRFEIDKKHEYYENGIDTSMSIDRSTHSLFGASKAAADLLVQEYGRYFGMPTVCFRAGCITGPNHAGTELHGFLSYLAKCCHTENSYTVFGHNGKQVRDNIHSYDLIKAFDYYRDKPTTAAVYNIGGGRSCNCSVLEAIDICEDLTGKTMKYNISETSRIGDHIWWISDITEFYKDYPEWKITYQLEDIIQEIFDYNGDRWLSN